MSKQLKALVHGMHLQAPKFLHLHTVSQTTGASELNAHGASLMMSTCIYWHNRYGANMEWSST